MLCPHIIISPTSLSWWGAFLSNHDSVVAPKDLQTTEGYIFQDYYPSSWTLID